MFKIATLITRRLELRLVKISDAAAIYESYASNPAVTKFLTWRPHTSVAEVQSGLRRLMISGYRRGECLPWVVMKRSDKSIIGMIELRLSMRGGQSHAGDLGYVLAEPEWGKGYMTEALKRVLMFAFVNLGLKRVGAYCDIANKASAKVLTKAGMKREGILHRFAVHPNIDEQPRDCLSFAIWKS